MGANPDLEGAPLTLCADTGIDYDRSGPHGGTTVVLLHAGVADRRMWEPQWTSLTGEHDVVRLDLRGFGGSVVRPEEPFAHHEDVAQTLSSLGVDRQMSSAARWGPVSRSRWPWLARSWWRRCCWPRPAVP
jgi:pimeloyl-ACP methyl ester carboxylesterase